MQNSGNLGMGIRCLLSVGIRCLLSKVRGSWEKTLYPLGTKFAGCDGGPNRNLGLPAGRGSGKHIEGGPGQGKLTGQKDWLAWAQRLVSPRKCHMMRLDLGAA